MISTPKGAIVRTCELVQLQGLLEDVITHSLATIQAHTPASDKLDRQTIRECERRLYRARKLWRSIENTHVHRDDKKMAAQLRSFGPEPAEGSELHS